MVVNAGKINVATNIKPALVTVSCFNNLFFKFFIVLLFNNYLKCLFNDLMVSMGKKIHLTLIVYKHVIYREPQRADNTGDLYDTILISCENIDLIIIRFN